MVSEAALRREREECAATREGAGGGGGGGPGGAGSWFILQSHMSSMLSKSSIYRGDGCRKVFGFLGNRVHPDAVKCQFTTLTTGSGVSNVLRNSNIAWTANSACGLTSTIQ